MNCYEPDAAHSAFDVLRLYLSPAGNALSLDALPHAPQETSIPVTQLRLITTYNI